MVSSPKKVGSLSCWPKGGSSDGLGWNVCLGGGALVLSLCRGNCSSDTVESVSGASTAGAAERGNTAYWSLSLTQESSYVHLSSDCRTNICIPATKHQLYHQLHQRTHMFYQHRNPPLAGFSATARHRRRFGKSALMPEFYRKHF